MGGRSRRQEAYTVQVDYYVPIPVRVSRLLKTVERFDYLTRTMTELGSNLAAEVTQAAGFSSATQGYQLGGWAIATANRALVQKMPFTTEVFAPAAFTLSAARRDHCAIETAGAGYVLGGRSGDTRQTNIRKIATATDTFSTLAASLATARNLAAVAGNSAKALLAGGQGDSGVLSTIEKLTYATELVAPAGDSLDIASKGLAGTSSNRQGFYAGGAGGTNAEISIQSVDFTSEAVIVRGIQLSRDRDFDGDAAFSDYLPVS